MLDEVRTERESLEQFLFNDANKVSKGVIKYVLSKWSILETRLQQEILEKETLLAVAGQTKQGPSYAQAAASTPRGGRAPGKAPLKLRKQEREVLIVKPRELGDSRSNEELNKTLMDVLKENRKNLKVRGHKAATGKGCANRGRRQR